MHFLGDRAADQAQSGSRMSLAQTTITTTDTRKMIVAAAFTSGVIPRRSSPQIWSGVAQRVRPLVHLTSHFFRF
jgi:hypothetical protein